MTIGGAEPGVQGDAAIARTTEKAHSGNDSLKVTGRNADWHGVTWDVKNALASGGAGTYALEAYVLGVDGETLGYTVNAANDNWLGVPAVTLSSANWTRLYGTITVSENDLEAVNREGWATLYPGGSGAGDYYIDDVRLWKIDGDMRICGAEPYAQGGTISYSQDVTPVSGADTLLSQGRGETYQGAAWSVPAASLGDLKTAGGWEFSMKARSAADAMNLTYNFQFWYSGDVNDCKYLSVSSEINSSSWTELKARWIIPEEYLADSLQSITVYPTTGAGQLGDYYLDAPSLVGFSLDDVTIGGAEPGVQGDAAIARTTEKAHSGNDSLKVTGRNADWHGVTWDVKNALASGGAGTYALEAYVLGVDGETLGYTVNAANDNWLGVPAVTLSSANWTRLYGTITVSENDLEAVNREGWATLYPGGSGAGDYYIDDVRLWKIDGDMRICGAEPYAQGGTISYSQDVTPVSGADTLLSQGRGETYQGAAWSVPAASLGDLKTAGGWEFSMKARSAADAMNLTYNFQFWYSGDVNDCKYLSVSSEINSSSWTELKARWIIPEEYLADSLQSITVYPTTGAGQLGDYYLDAPSLVGFSLDDMALGGVQPSPQAADIQRVEDMVYTGNDSLYVSNRQAYYSGAAWYLQPSAFQSGKWNFTAYVRAKDTDVNLTYNLELKYADKDWKYYTIGPVTATKDGWVKLSGDMELSSSDLAGLTGATLYPVTGNEKKWDSGDYYIDGVDFKRTGDVSTPDNMKLGGAEPSSQGAALKRVTDVVYTGKDSLYVSNREAFYAGAAWYLQPSAFQSGKWNFTAYVRAKDTDVSLTYNLELKYADKDWKYYAVGPVTATKSGWVKLSGDLELLPSDLEGLTGAALYPVTGNERSWDRGDYYIDGVSFQRTGAADYIDNMTIAGKYFFKHGGDDSFDAVRVTWPVAAGDSALLVQNRALVFAGAGWDVKELLQSGGAGTWTFRASARSAYASQHLAYSVYLRYLDGTEDWLFCAGADIDSGGWVTLSGDAYSTTGHAMDFDNLEIATLYPCTNEGQLGDYYIDNVSFVRTGDAIPTAPSGTNQHYGYDYFPLDGGFEEKLGLGEPGYAFQHGGEVGLSIASGISYEGNHSCYVFNREFPYSGPGYDVTAYLREQGWGNWFFTAWAMAEDEPMTLSYSVYLKFEDGTEDWLYPAYTTYLEPGQWVRVNSDYQDGDSRLRSSSGKTYDFNQLVMATLYPCTGEGELGNFYIDAVSFYKGADGYKDPVFTFEGSFPLDGEFEEVLKIGAPGNVFKHGESSKLERASDVANKGKYSLLVSDRESPYSGPGWVVTDYLKQEGWGDWYFSAYGRASDTAGTLGLGYSIYLQFEDGTEEWLVCGRQTYLSSKGWTRINGDTTGNPIRLSTMNGTTITDFDELTYAVLYPNTDEGMLGDYYIDSVQLWREDPEAVKETGIENETAPTITPEPEQAMGVNWPLVVGLWGGGVLVAAGVTGGFVFYRKRRQK